MLLTGTVVADAHTVIEDGAVVTEGAEIAAVGDAATLRESYPDHDHRSYDVLMPGLVGGHIHSVQSLGRGLGDDNALLEWLFEYILPMEANLSADGMRTAAELGYLELIESGVTTCVDHLSVSHADEAFEAAIEMGIRGRIGKVLMDKESPPGLLEDTDAALAESERLIRAYHGAADGRIRYAVTPRFAVSCSEACLRGTRELVDKYDGVRIHTHASENKDEIETVEADTGMRNIHWLDEVGLTGEDVVLAHCVWTDESEREVLAETGTHVTYCPSSNMKLASGTAPIVDYLDRGINVAIGNDGAPSNNTMDPFTEMRNGCFLQKVDTLDEEVVPAETVIEMATVNGAKAAGFDRLGKLQAGWRADIVGLTTDLTRATPLNDVRSHLVYSAHADDVRFTMVDGEVLMDDGEVTVVDADAIRQRARNVELDLSTDAERPDA
jgi:cytosine/adenosine deaminase-related metal-dependent hydrolase